MAAAGGLRFFSGYLRRLAHRPQQKRTSDVRRPPDFVMSTEVETSLPFFSIQAFGIPRLLYEAIHGSPITDS